MGGATVGVGLLPDAAAIGPAAPLLLILLRVLQGLAVGGEWGGAVLLATENAPDGKRGIFSAIPQVGPPLGFAMTAATLLITGATMSPEQFLQWGWRIPFLLSIVLIVIGFWVRRTIGESPEYVAAMVKMEAKRVPIVEVFQRHWRQVAISTLAVTPVFVFFYLGSVYLTSYGTANLGLPSQTMLAFGLAGAAGFAAVTVLSAHWSDRVGRKRLIIISAVVAIIWGPLLFPVVDNGGELGVAIGVVLTMSAVGIGYGSLAALLAEMFPAEYRYTGVGLVYNLGGVLGGSMTPLVAAALAASFGSVSIGIVVALVGLVAVVAALTLRDQPQVAAGAAAPSEIG
jgi:MFS family permease